MSKKLKAQGLLKVDTPKGGSNLVTLDFLVENSRWRSLDLRIDQSVDEPDYQKRSMLAI